MENSRYTAIASNIVKAIHDGSMDNVNQYVNDYMNEKIFDILYDERSTILNTDRNLMPSFPSK